MNILCLTVEYPPKVGGIATHTAELARHLSLLDNTVTVFTPGTGGNLRTAQSPSLTIYRQRFRYSGWPLFDLQLALWLRRHTAEAKPDIIHVHGMKPLPATRGFADVPTVFTNHTSGFLKRLRSSQYRKSRTLRRLEHVSALIAPSRELAEASREIGYSGPVHYIPNGVDTGAFRFDADARARHRKSWACGDDAVLLLARRLVPKNGVKDFAEACGYLADYPCRIVIAGDGPERPEMEEIFAVSGLRERVLFLGSVPNPEMPGIYSAADIAVLPSHMEATSISGLEAMACGLSLVGTDVGGIPDLISDGVTGSLVPARDPQALAAGIRNLVESSPRRQAFGDAARQKAVSRFAWPEIARRTLEVLVEAAKR
ncbi:MAG: glycosyltransferase family 4 protein [Alphaproteobacteria bacterium]|nr:glycosyltransferase family 4 protein [Alphaproteobacteria bacterium]